jgi:glycosyltransferase involved in cell wall biosynthesis
MTALVAKPLRVALLIGSLAHGGAERQLVTLACGLRRRGHAVQVLTLRPGNDYATELEAAGVRVSCLEVPLLRPWWTARGKLGALAALTRTLRTLHTVRPDILHCWLFEAEAWGLLAKLFAAPGRLVTIRGNMGNDLTRSPWRRLVRACTNLLAAAVISNSSLLARHALRTELLLRRSRVYVIRNGLDAEAIERIPPADRSALPAGIPADAPLVACVANLFAYKGHEDLIRAWATVHRAMPSAHLLLIGRDEGRGDALGALAHDVGVGRVVHVLGGRADAVALVKLARVFVLPSHEEGLPNAVIEAMLAGVPVVATRVGGMPEAVRHDRTGLLVEAGDVAALGGALVRLLDDAELAGRLARRARISASRRFSAERLIAGHLEVYRSTWRHRHGSGPVPATSTWSR